ncbi:hypothetical protein M3Y98_00604500 [Aphelenchoides besseyi]|nr:hypothetical protein M3Y98_00604500 [Aphelenchoides besseyi]KAI6208223.1 hypothetical protein M3Y96_00092500 [Aphelenchoides besseyi]
MVTNDINRQQFDYQASNPALNVHVLEQPKEAIYNDHSTVVPSFSSVNDKNSTLGPDSISIENPLDNSQFLFASSDGLLDSTRTTFRYNGVSEPLRRLSLTNGIDIVEPPNGEVNKKYEDMQLRRKKKEEKKRGGEIKPEDQPGYIGSKEVDDILRELEPNRVNSEKSSKKKKKSNGLRKNKNLRTDENEEIEVEVELDQDDVKSPSPTTELKAKSPGKTNDSTTDENISIESTDQQYENDQMPNGEKNMQSKINKSPVNDVKSGKTAISPPLVEPLVEETEKTIYNEEDLLNMQTLKLAWARFQDKYAGRIKQHDDRKVINNKTGRRNDSHFQDAIRVKMSNGSFSSSTGYSETQTKSSKKQNKQQRR